MKPTPPPGEPILSIEPGMIVEWTYTPNWSVSSRLVVERIDGLYAWVRFEEGGTLNRLSLTAIRNRARLVGRVGDSGACEPHDRDAFDRFADWIHDKFSGERLRAYLGDEIFSRADLFLAVGGTFALHGPRKWAFVPIFVAWLLVRAWVDREPRP